MKRMYKFILLILLLIPIGIKAEEIDVNRKGNINIIYKYGGTNLGNVKVYIYKVANLDINDRLTYLDEYKLDDSLVITSASKWNDLAIKINNYIKDNDIKYISSCTTDDLGNCKLNNLDIGLYLVVTDKLTIDDYEYSSSPSLIRLPNYNQIDYKLMYDVDMILKSESRLIRVNQEEEENMKLCTTGCCYPWIIVSICLFIILLILVAYILRLKKGSDK